MIRDFENMFYRESWLNEINKIYQLVIYGEFINFIKNNWCIINLKLGDNNYKDKTHLLSGKKWIKI